MQMLFAILAPLLYLLTAVALAWRLFGEQESTVLTRPRLLLLGFIALLAHAIGIYFEIAQSGGINLAFFDAMSLSGLFIAAVLLLSSLGKRVENLGIVLFPGIAIAIVMANISQAGLLLNVHANWGISLHILT